MCEGSGVVTLTVCPTFKGILMKIFRKMPAMQFYMLLPLTIWACRRIWTIENCDL